MSQKPEKKQRVRVKVSELQAKAARIAELEQQLQATQAQMAKVYGQTMKWLMLAIYQLGREKEDGSREVFFTETEYKDTCPLLKITRVPVQQALVPHDAHAVFRVTKMTPEEAEADRQATLKKLHPQPKGKIIIPR